MLVVGCGHRSFAGFPTLSYSCGRMETRAKCGRPPLITSPFWVERGRRSESSLVGARGSFPGESSLHSFSVRSCPGGLAVKGLLGEGAYYLHG